MVHVVVLSFLLGLFVDEWWWKLAFAPLLIGTYAVTAFRFSRSAKVIADVETDNSWKWLYAPIFAFHFLLAAGTNGVFAVLGDALGFSSH